jgi:anti-anti-sigma regulatory factor
MSTILFVLFFFNLNQQSECVGCWLVNVSDETTTIQMILDLTEVHFINLCNIIHLCCTCNDARVSIDTPTELL